VLGNPEKKAGGSVSKGNGSKKRPTEVTLAGTAAVREKHKNRKQDEERKKEMQ